MNLEGYTVEIHLPKSPKKVKQLQEKLTDVTTDIWKKRLDKDSYEHLIKRLEEDESELYL